MEFTKFSEWESQKYSKKIEEDASKVSKDSKTPENAALIAQLADVVKSRKEAIRNKDDFEAQILEIESKLIKLDIDKNDLITIKTPINQENIEHSYTQFIEVVKQLPCDKIVHQSGGYIINKTNKYRYKLNNNLNNKSNDIYFDKLLHWNTLYKIYKINKKLIK